jgi:vacuolar-type H+-ATPase subunit D/Vma8
MTIVIAKRVALICAVFLLGTACTSLYYSAMEHLGKEKRDILVKRLIEAKKDQEETKEQLKTTLQAFQEVTGFKGGNLEKVYNKLNKEYERSEDRAHKLKGRIESIDHVAKDLFSEWQGEVSGIHNRTLKTQSEALLRNARQQHAQYMKQMYRTEKNIQPVLQAFSDQVTFLKHNLNARAISSLKSTSAQIDTQAAELIRDIDASTREADNFIQTLSAADTR